MPLFTRKKVENELKKLNSNPSSPVKKASLPNLMNGNANTNTVLPSPEHSASSGGTSVKNMPLREFEEPFLFVTPLRIKSRLSKTLEDLLHDVTAVGYFVQYMESRNGSAYIRFWLDAESFHSSAQTRLQSHSIHAAEESKRFSNRDHQGKKFCTIPAGIDYLHSCQLSGSDTCLADICAQCKSQVPTWCSPNAARANANQKDKIMSDGDSIVESERRNSCELPATESLPDSEVSRANCSPDLKLGNSHRVASPCKSAVSSVSCSNPNLDGCPESSLKQDGSSMDGTEKLKQGHNSALFSHTRSWSSDSMLIHKLKKTIAEDAVKIFSQYVAKDAALPVGVSDELRNEITAKICQEDGHVDPLCFASAQLFVIDIMKKDYFPDYALSDYHCKYQIDVLTSGKVYLEDILYNDTALSYFMEFMEQEGNRHLLEFFLSTANFRQHLMTQRDTYDALQSQDDAMILYDKYFSLQATCPLGFNDTVRFEVEQNICREEGPQPDCFEKPMKMVFHYLQKNFLKPFLSSQLYFTYLSELLNSSKADHEVAGCKRRAGSDTSSEHSSSISNTLLAMDSAQTSGTRKIIKNVEERDMRIDTGVLNNPDALWKRSMAGKLSFGRINRLGKFIPELEPEPDRKRATESVLSKAMKKFVNREEDKAKQDMAWQIAEMVIKEVTSVTCPETE